MFVALAGDELIGTSGLMLDSDEPNRAELALTAVRREHRRGDREILERLQCDPLVRHPPQLRPFRDRDDSNAVREHRVRLVADASHLLDLPVHLGEPEPFGEAPLVAIGIGHDRPQSEHG
jgi:hypothetical protein